SLSKSRAARRAYRPSSRNAYGRRWRSRRDVASIARGFRPRWTNARHDIGRQALRVCLEGKMNANAVNLRTHFENAVQKLKDEKRYRVFANLERDASRFPTALWRPDSAEEAPRDVTIWCSNDYLGMGGHPAVLEATRAALGRHGV